jgi:hypothetical protein
MGLIDRPVINSPSSSVAINRRRSSMTEHSFHGVATSRTKVESVTHVSGTSTMSQAVRHCSPLGGDLGAGGMSGQVHAKGRRLMYVDDYEEGRQSRELQKGAAAVNARSVICLDDGKVYGTVSEAATAYGTTQPHVTSVCKGVRGAAAGHKFAYLDEFKKGEAPSFPKRTKGAGHHRARAVICVDTGERWSTITDAARSVGVTTGAIWNACQGKARTVAGRRWRYEDSE